MGKRLQKITVYAILIMLAVILELIVSNYRVFFIDKDAYETEIDALESITEHDEDGRIAIVKEAQTVVVQNVPSGIYALRLSYICPDEVYFYEPVKLQIKAVDAKNSKALSTVLTTYIAPSEDESSTTLVLKLDELSRDYIQLAFSGSVNDFYLTDVTINPEALFSFNFVRMLLILCIAVLIYIIVRTPVKARIFDAEKTSHIVTLCAFSLVALVAVCIFVGMLCGTTAGIPYPLTNGVQSYNPYVQQTDAFLKGQLNIDYYPSDDFLALENPYDTAQRDGLYYLWDRAYYEGEYFSYFGIAPILNVYLPYYALTGNLPGDGTVKLLYAVTCSAFIFLFITAYVVIYKKKVSLPLLCLGMLSAVLSSNLLMMARGSQPFYYIATIAGMSYLAGFLFFLLLAINSRHRIARPVLFCVSGLMYALLFLSRINIAFFAAFIVLPVLYFALIRGKDLVTVDARAPIGRSIKGKLIDISALGAFVLVAVVFTLIYNYARFDSPFEFGTSYQLTVSDTSRNSMSLAALPDALYHYLLQPIAKTNIFPFFTLQYYSGYNYGGYVYVDTGMGLFAIPLMLGLFALIFVFTSKRHTRFIKVLTASMLVGALVTAWLDFCLGGVIFRYTSDITLPLSLAATLGLLSLCEHTPQAEDGGAFAARRIVVSALMLASCAVMLCLAISYNGNLTDYDSKIFVSLMKLFGAQ